MKIEEFRELSDADLTAKVSELRANLMTLRFQQKSGLLPLRVSVVMESRSPLKTRRLSNYGRRKYRWKEETYR